MQVRATTISLEQHLPSFATLIWDNETRCYRTCQISINSRRLLICNDARWYSERLQNLFTVAIEMEENVYRHISCWSCLIISAVARPILTIFGATRKLIPRHYRQYMWFLIFLLLPSLCMTSPIAVAHSLNKDVSRGNVSLSEHAILEPTKRFPLIILGYCFFEQILHKTLLSFFNFDHLEKFIYH